MMVCNFLKNTRQDEKHRQTKMNAKERDEISTLKDKLNLGVCQGYKLWLKSNIVEKKISHQI